MVKYSFEGKHYKIVITEEENDDDNRKREEQLLRDFKHLESQHDYATIKNRIISGTSWDWLIEINPNEVIEPTNNEGGFW